MIKSGGENVYAADELAYSSYGKVIKAELRKLYGGS